MSEERSRVKYEARRNKRSFILSVHTAERDARFRSCHQEPYSPKPAADGRGV